MRSLISIALIVLALSIGVLTPVAAEQLQLKSSLMFGCSRRRFSGVPLRYASIEPLEGGLLFVGGQNGSWFQSGQFPRLGEISLPDYSYTQLTPVRSGGTVWGGGFNGSQLLVSGWGTDDGSPGPYIWLYDGLSVVTQGSLDEYGQASSWNGGDIFAASYNGREWLLSGLGSGPLSNYFEGTPSNHMALGLFDGASFTDLSGLVPDQQDEILYTNAWNGQYWLVGGGWLSSGILFTLNGNTTVDLTTQAAEAISNFTSVQSVAWNGNYWLIGGMGFLAKYDGHTFVDLTPQLEYALGTKILYSVNTIAWNGQSWMIGGGRPIAQLGTSHAWVAVYNRGDFYDLSSSLPTYVSDNTQNSSILDVTPVGETWVLGGYSGTKGLLLTYDEATTTDYSNLLNNFTYVDWVSGIQAFTF
jgi:hypothetical protein